MAEDIHQVASRIRFHLSTLRARNGHHVFEEICLHFAMQRISPFILPATGPVGAGGDGGRDFETFRTFRDGENRMIAAACTLKADDLRSKIRSDLEKILAGTPVDAIYVFTEADLPVGHRRELKALVNDPVSVDFIDGTALATHLAQPSLRWIADRYLGASDAPNTPTRRGLPRRRSLIGRDAELARGRAVIADRERPVLLLHGLPGVGKSALAWELAWVTRGDFPSGVVAVEVQETGDFLTQVLLALDPSSQASGDHQLQCARIGALLSGPKQLLVLDNVHDEEALSGLLNIDGSFAAVCTSRSRFTGLACEGVEALEVRPLQADDAEALARTVSTRLTVEESKTLARVCGFLPIAVLIAAARIEKRPQLSVSAYLLDLADPDHGSGELRAGGKSVDRIVEDSFRLLPDGLGPVFLTLGLLPGTSVTADVITAASASGEANPETELALTRRRLDELLELHLIEQISENSYRLHDVLYRFARHKALSTTDRAWHELVISRVCRAYASRTSRALTAIGSADTGQSEQITTISAALATLEHDHVGATSMTEQAAGRELWGEFIDLAAVLTPALQHLGRWEELARIASCLADGGKQTGQTNWQASGLLNLGTVAARRGEPDVAVDRFRECIEVAGDDHLWIAETARTAYGDLLLSVGRADEAIPVLRQSLHTWRLLGSDTHITAMLSSLGKANLAMARWDRAQAYLRNSLRVAKRAGIRTVSSSRLALAHALRSSGQSADAQAECEAVLHHARTVGNREAEADALQELGTAQLAQDADDAALTTLGAAVKIYREVGDARSEVTTLLLMGTAAEEQGKRAEAFEYFEDCMEKSQRIDALSTLAQALAHIANLYAEAGRHEQADEFLHEAIAVAAETRSTLVLVQVQHQQAKILRRIGKIDQILPLLRRRVSILMRRGESDPLAEARTALGDALIQHGDWQEAASVLHLVADAPSSMVRPRTRASAFRFLAGLYSRRELWPEAMHAADQAVHFAELSGSQGQQMHCRHARGNVHARMSQWPQASAEYETAATLAAALSDFQTMLIIRSNQAASRLAAGDFAKAVDLFRGLLSHAEALGTDEIRSSLLVNLGNALSAQGDHEGAKEQYELALGIARSLETADLVAQASIQLGKAHLALRNPGAAVDCYHQARSTWQKSGDMAAASEALEQELSARIVLAEQAGTELTQASFPNSVPEKVLDTLHARHLARETARETVPLDRLPGRRTIMVSHEVAHELEGLAPDTLFARLATSRRHCLECGLSIADDGQANAILMMLPDGLLSITLAHPACAPSAVVVSDRQPDISRVNFEIECVVFEGDLPGVIVDTRGPWGTNAHGQSYDLFLDSLRESGFANVNERPLESAGEDGLQLVRTAAKATLAGNHLAITLDNDVVLPRMPLAFMPKWYAATNSHTLVVLFGYDLRGMAADDPSYLRKSAQTGTLVGAVVELTVVPPPRNRPCVCTPETNRKFKHCCGRTTQRDPASTSS